VEQVLLPLSGCDRSTGEGSVVVLHIGHEYVETSNKSLDMEEEVGSLFVSYLTVALVGWSCQS
jgi:hypothetical protein